MGASRGKLHKIRRGLDVPLAGDPQQRVEEGRGVDRVAVLADDYPGLRPRMGVKVGDRVIRGERLFEDRKNPGVFHTAPASGTVEAVVRGERRALRSVIIAVDRDADASEEKEYEASGKIDGRAASADDARALLLESGMWTALRSRPFGKVPAPGAKARAIFVTAVDTQPHAPEVEIALEGREGDFEGGLEALVSLGDGAPVYLCVGAGSSLAGVDVPGVEVHRFEGPHPAGNAGLHIHLIDPVDLGRTAWHVGYQDTAAIGHLFRTGKLSVERVVSVAGPMARKPRLLRTRIGADLAGLLEGEILDGETRIVTGSVLAGRIAAGDVGFLGRHHNQISLLQEGGEREFLGWMGPGFSAYSTSRLFVSSFLPAKKRPLRTLLGGGIRAMIPNGSYDAVMPFDVMPVFLFKALLSNDLDAAQRLGCLELDEEDVALCTFVCPSKIDHGRSLRRVLDAVEKEES